MSDPCRFFSVSNSSLPKGKFLKVYPFARKTRIFRENADFSSTHHGRKISLIFALVLFFSPCFGHEEAISAAAAQTEVSPKKISLSDLSVPFVENQGQIGSEDVKYYAEISGGLAFVKNREISYAIGGNSDSFLSFAESFIGNDGAGIELNPIGIEPSPTRVSYYEGSEPNRWKTNLPNYRELSFGELWPGTEVVLKAYAEKVEKVFVLKPKADPGNISLRLSGIGSSRIDGNGELVLHVSGQEVRMTKPVAYQTDETGIRRDIDVAYSLDNDKYGFAVGEYDTTLPLIIDPMIASTYLSTGTNWSPEMMVATANGLYLTGRTVAGVGDAYVRHLSSDLTQLLQTVTLAGSDGSRPMDIAADGTGSIFLTGSVANTTLPVTTGPAMPGSLWGAIGFITKFDSSLNMTASRIYGTGGTVMNAYYTRSAAVYVNGADEVYIGGITSDPGLEMAAGAYDNSINGGADNFLAKFSNDLMTLAGSTFYGGSDASPSIEVKLAGDASGNVFLSGNTFSSDLPAGTSAGWDPTYNGPVNNSDLFIAKFDSDLTALAVTTYLGGSTAFSYDNVAFNKHIAVDADGEVFVAGVTRNTADFPISPDALYPTYTNDGRYGMFISKFDNDLSTLVKSTFIGDPGESELYSLTLDSQGNAFVSGYEGTNYGSSHQFAPERFPLTNGSYYDVAYYYQAFVTKFNNDLTQILSSTATAEIGWDYPMALLLAVEPTTDNVFIDVSNVGSDTQVSPGAYDTIYNTNKQYILKLDDDLSASVGNLTPNAPSNLGPAGLVNGSTTNDTTPSFSFSITDPNGGDLVRYRIQIAEDSNYEDLEFDFVSDFVPQGNQTFVPGQAMNGVAYYTDMTAWYGVGDDLDNGYDHYWRVKAIDAHSDSGWVEANGGAAAFHTDITYVPPAGIAVSGTVYDTDGTTPLATQPSIKLEYSGTAYSGTVAVNGTYSFPNVAQPKGGDILTIWLDTGGTENATAVVKYGTACAGYPDCTGIDLFKGRVVVNSKNVGGPIHNSDLAGCDDDTGAACSDTDIGFTSAAAVLNLTWANNQLRAEGYFEPNGNVSAKKLVVEGIFVGHRETLKLTGEGNSSTCSNFVTAMPLCVVGTFSPPETTQFTGDSSSIAGSTYRNLSLGADADSVAATYTLAGNANVSGAITVGNAASTNADIFNAGSATLTLSGAGEVFTLTSQGQFEPATSTVVYTGNGKIAAVNYNQLKVGPITRFIKEGNFQMGGQEDFDSAVIDEKNGFAYFASGDSNLQRPVIVKIDLRTYAKAASLTLPISDFPYDTLGAGVIDQAGQYAYFGSAGGVIAKIRLSDFTYVGALTLNAGEINITTAVVDGPNNLAYFATNTSPARVIKVSIDPANFVRVGAVTLNAGERYIRSGGIDLINHMAYFGTNEGAGTPGKIIKVNVDPNTFARVTSVTMNAGEAGLFSTLLDPANDYGYFGCNYASPGRIVRMKLSDLTHQGVLTLNAGENGVRNSPTADLAAGFAYFASGSNIIKVNINPAGFARVGAVAVGDTTANGIVIDTVNGNLYVSRVTWPGSIAKVRLSDFTLASILTGFPETGTSIISGVVDHGNGFAYFGTYTGPGQVLKYDLKRSEYVGRLTLNAGESNLFSAVIDEENGFAYFATDTSPARIVKVNIDPNNFSRVGAITLNPGESYAEAAVADLSAGYAYFGLYTTPGRIAKIDIDPARSFARSDVVTMADAADCCFRAAAFDSTNKLGYFVTDDSPARVVKMDLGPAFSKISHVELNAGEMYGESIAIDRWGEYAYVGMYTSPGIVVKVRLSDMTRVNSVTLGAGENRLMSAAIDPSGKYAYFGTNSTPSYIVQIDGTTMTKTGVITGEGSESSIAGVAIDQEDGRAYFTMNSWDGYVVKLDTGSMPVFGTNTGQTISVASDLTIEGPAAARGYNSTINIGGDLTIPAAGTFDSTSGVLTIGGDLNNQGTFNPQGGTVAFGGSGASLVSGADTFANLAVTVPGKALQFATAGSPVYTFTGSLTVTGNAGSHVSISSDAAGVQWIAHFNSDQTISFATVTDSGCDAGTSNVTANFSTDGTNNGTCWIFAASNQNPNAPVTLGPASFVNGSTGSDNTPTLTFDLSDPDGADTVRYRLQIDDTPDYSSPVIDYTSGLAAAGSHSFTAGQAAGTGSYEPGSLSAGQSLPDGSYYWRVKAIDNSAAESAYVTANAGVAFVIDTSVPSVPPAPGGSGGSVLLPPLSSDEPDAIAKNDPDWTPDHQGNSALTGLTTKDQCKAFDGQIGWYGRYYDYPRSHQDMELPSGVWSKSYGDPLSDAKAWSADWFDSKYFRFAKASPNLAFGKHYFPFDYESKEFTAGHDYFFGAHYSSKVAAAIPGYYPFRISSDDDSWVYVDGKLLIDNHGVHGATTRTATVYLSGTHTFDVYFAERHTTESHLYFAFDNPANLSFTARSAVCLDINDKEQPKGEDNQKGNEAPAIPAPAIENNGTPSSPVIPQEPGNGGVRPDDNPAAPAEPAAATCKPLDKKTLRAESRKIEAAYRQAVKSITAKFSASIKEARRIRSESYRQAANASLQAKNKAYADADDIYSREMKEAANKRDADLAKTKDKKVIKQIKDSYKAAEKTASSKRKDSKKQAENARKELKSSLVRQADAAYQAAAAAAQAERTNALAAASADRDGSLTALKAPCPVNPPITPPVTPPAEQPVEDEGESLPVNPPTEDNQTPPNSGGDTNNPPSESSGPGNGTTVLGIAGTVSDALANAAVKAGSTISFVFRSTPPDLQDFGREPFAAATRVADKLPGGKLALNVAAPLGALAIPVVTSAPAMATSSAIGLYEFFLILIRAFRDFLGFVGLRKKRRYWGTAYDSSSKQPLDPVVVKLIDVETGKTVETAITDLMGRFGFLPRSGEFRLDAAKKGYRFPSTRIIGEKDEIYENLYRGETLKVSESELVAPNIPMDPLAFDWNQQAKMNLIKFSPRKEWLFQVLSDVIFWFGLALVVFAFLAGPNAWNACLLALYLLIIGMRFFLPKRRLWGRVTATRSVPASELSLELFHPGLEQVVLTKAGVSPAGRFFLKANPGEYLLKVKRGEQLVGQTKVKVGKDGTLNQDIRV